MESLATRTRILLNLSVPALAERYAFTISPRAAGIHFSPARAIEAIEAGAAKIRLNPGNVPQGHRPRAHVAEALVEAPKAEAVDRQERLERQGEGGLYETLSRSNLVTTKYWYLAAGVLFAVTAGATCAFLYMMATGLGVTGLSRPVMWGVMIILFVFCIGLSHSGTLISAILRITQAGWRAPVLRGAEAMTVFAVMIAGLFPFIHLGRVWQVYYMLPLPNQRLLWPNFLSPLMFDVVAISTYLTVSSLFWYTGLVPDLAVVRDRSRRRGDRAAESRGVGPGLRDDGRDAARAEGQKVVRGGSWRDVPRRATASLVRVLAPLTASVAEYVGNPRRSYDASAGPHPVPSRPWSDR